VPADNTTSWQVFYPLDAGQNTLTITTINNNGLLSDPATVTIPVAAGNQADADLVALWHFDGTWSDYSGNNNTWSPTAQHQWSGLHGRCPGGSHAASFDGVNDYAEAPGSGGLSIGSQSWSISAWVKTQSFGSSRMMVVSRSSTNTLSNLYLDEWVSPTSRCVRTAARRRGFPMQATSGTARGITL